MFGRGSMKIDVAAFPDPVEDETLVPSSGTTREVVLAGGCFWCTEAVYRELAGVVSVEPGYSGGAEAEASYPVVCSGTTDHAEAIRIVYDPARTSLGRLLKVFFSVAHDPTQVDRQGHDCGRQYRSAVFCADEEQTRIARAYIEQLDAHEVFSAPIATRLETLAGFYAAEASHRNYAARNPGQPYIAAVAMPKVDKLRRYFGDQLREG